LTDTRARTGLRKRSCPPPSASVVSTESCPSQSRCEIFGLRSFEIERVDGDGTEREQVSGGPRRGLDGPPGRADRSASPRDPVRRLRMPGCLRSARPSGQSPSSWRPFAAFLDRPGCSYSGRSSTRVRLIRSAGDNHPLPSTVRPTLVLGRQRDPIAPILSLVVYDERRLPVSLLWVGGGVRLDRR